MRGPEYIRGGNEDGAVWKAPSLKAAGLHDALNAVHNFAQFPGVAFGPFGRRPIGEKQHFIRSHGEDGEADDRVVS